MLVAVTLLVLLGALSLWSRTRPALRSLLLGGLVLAAAQITGSLIFVGLLGQLNRPAVVVANCSVSLFIILWNRKTLVPTLREIGVGLVPVVFTLCRTPWMLISATVLLLAMLWTLWLGIVLPPTDWDGLAQNLPTARFHIQNGDIQPIQTPYRGIRAYPQGGSLLLAYIMLLDNGDTFVDLVQFPAWLLGTLAVYALGRELGAQREHAFLGALVFAAAPVAILQARTAYYDLAVAAVALASLALILDSRIGLLPRALVTGAGGGLLIGLKYAGLIYAGVLLVLLGILLFRERLPRGRWPVILAGHLGILLLLGGCWYAWNVVEYRNPFWPMQVQLGGRTLLPGVWTSSSFYEGAAPAIVAGQPYLAGLLAVWREPATRYAADVRTAGLGPLWLALGLPALLLCIVQTVRRPTVTRGGLLFFVLATFLLTPANWHTRYVLASAGAAGACAAVMLEEFTPALRSALGWLISALACLMLVAVPVHGAGSPQDVVRNLQLPPVLRQAVFMDDVPAMDDALRWSGQNIPAGSRVAYGWGGVVLYPLFGAKQQNALIYFQAGDSDTGNVSSRGDYAVVREGTAEAQAARRDANWTEVFASDTYLVFARTPHE